MKRWESLKKVLVLQLPILGLLLQTAIYACVWLYSYHGVPYNMYLKIRLYFWGHLLVFFIYFLLLLLFSQMYGALRIGYYKPFDLFLSKLFALLCVNLLTYFEISLFHNNLAKAGPILEMTAVQLLLAAFWSFFSNRAYRLTFPPRELLLVHGDRPIEGILQKFSTRPDKYRIMHCMHISEGLEKIQAEAQQNYTGVVLWDIPMDIRNKLLKFCYGHTIRIYMMPKIPDVLVKGSEQLHLFDTPILMNREYALTFGQRVIKRCMDFVLALLLLIVASPIMLVTAAVIKLYDGGPVLYRQVRCTRDAREFRIMKFRSMRVDAEKDGVARLAARNDGRITPIGRFIRTVRIDELPQLINIIKGEMSFIGPRPERPEIIAQYLEEMPEFAFRMKVKAGLAGYAQIYGKYNTTPYDKLKLDLTYIENYSVWLDLKLMLLTLKILFRPESTEGVDAAQVTALKNDVKEDNE